VDGIPDWTYDCVVAGVDAARARLQTDVIDIVHLHSCGLEPLETGEVTRALADCAAAGKLRVAAYSGDGAALRWAIAGGEFGSVQASLSLCDQQALRPLAEARACGLGTIAKRPLCGQPWRARRRPTTTCTPTTGGASRSCGRRSVRGRRLGGARPALRGWCARCGLRYRRRHRPRHLERNALAVRGRPLEPSTARRSARRMRRSGQAGRGASDGDRDRCG